MLKKEPAPRGKVRVTFSMPAVLPAQTVHLVGDFNHWNTAATPLCREETGWSVSLLLEYGRAYQYRYLLNGQVWLNDWQADQYVPNTAGGADSVVVALPRSCGPG